MKFSRYLLIMALSVWGGGAFAQPSATSTSRHARKSAHRKKVYDWMTVKQGTEWKAWLAKNFPDASSHWPAEVKRSFAELESASTWSYVSKGDIDRDAVPTVLLLKLKDGNPADGYRIVDKLVVAKWINGRWTELLDIAAEGGITVDGVKPGAMQSNRFKGYHLSFFAGDPEEAAHPGIWVSVRGVGGDGKVLTEDADFFYVPDAKRYGGNSY